MANKISRHQLARIVADISLGGKRTATLSKHIAAYLMEERRVAELDSLLRDVQKLWAEAGHVDVIAKMARQPESKTLVQQMTAPFKKLYPHARSVNVTPVLDPAVIGGVSLELADQRLDVSVARRMRRFKQAINQRGRG